MTKRTVSTGEIGAIYISFMVVVGVLATIGMLPESGTATKGLAVAALSGWYCWLTWAVIRAGFLGGHIRGKHHEGKGHWFPRTILFLLWAGSTISVPALILGLLR